MFNINVIAIPMFCILKEFLSFMPSTWSNSKLHQNSDLLAETFSITHLKGEASVHHQTSAARSFLSDSWLSKHHVMDWILALYPPLGMVHIWFQVYVHFLLLSVVLALHHQICYEKSVKFLRTVRKCRQFRERMNSFAVP
jgi:hypothetical protein